MEKCKSFLGTAVIAFSTCMSMNAYADCASGLSQLTSAISDFFKADKALVVENKALQSMPVSSSLTQAKQDNYYKATQYILYINQRKNAETTAVDLYQATNTACNKQYPVVIKRVSTWYGAYYEPSGGLPYGVLVGLSSAGTQISALQMTDADWDAVLKASESVENAYLAKK